VSALGRAARLVVPLALLLGAGARARAQTGGGDDLDDPKLARRLKTRVSVPLAAPAAANPTQPVPADPMAVAPSLPPPSGAPPPGPATPPSAADAPAFPPASRPSEPLAVAQRPAKSADQGYGRTATLQLGYRRFSFVRLGAVDSGAGNGKAASEPFDSLSLDFYPFSKMIRFGISTQYGWQSGTFNSGTGDYFIAESFSLGIQRPRETWTPFVQGVGGAGYMRRFQFDRTVPTAYWQFGLDAGAEVALARHAFLTASIGYLHPVNGFAKVQSFTTVYVDTWSFKIAIGI